MLSITVKGDPAPNKISATIPSPNRDINNPTIPEINEPKFLNTASIIKSF